MMEESMINFIAETPLIAFLIYVSLILLQLVQWVAVITTLSIGKDYTKKSDFLIRMFPGYFFIVIALFIWNTFEKFIMLD